MQSRFRLIGLGVLDLPWRARPKARLAGAKRRPFGASPPPADEEGRAGLRDVRDAMRDLANGAGHYDEKTPARSGLSEFHNTIRPAPIMPWDSVSERLQSSGEQVCFRSFPRFWPMKPGPPGRLPGELLDSAMAPVPVPSRHRASPPSRSSEINLAASMGITHRFIPAGEVHVPLPHLLSRAARNRKYLPHDWKKPLCCPLMIFP